jgi:ATP-dependent RNA helicase SUPV3L1/SUV3
VRGVDRLHPEVTVAGTPGAGARLRLAGRLLAFARDLVSELLAPLDIPGARALGPAARGLLYQLAQSLGSVAAAPVREQLDALDGRERRLLTDGGLVLGRQVVFAPALLRPEALERRRALCAAELWPGRTLPEAAGAHPERLPLSPEIPQRIYEALGYPVIDGAAVRADLVEAQVAGPRPRRRGRRRA